MITRAGFTHCLFAFIAFWEVVIFFSGFQLDKIIQVKSLGTKTIVCTRVFSANGFVPGKGKTKFSLLDLALLECNLICGWRL